MEATIGDKICIHGNIVGHADKHAEIIEVRGERGEPPYVVRFPDGQEWDDFPAGCLHHPPPENWIASGRGSAPNC